MKVYNIELRALTQSELESVNGGWRPISSWREAGRDFGRAVGRVAGALVNGIEKFLDKGSPVK